MPHYHLGVHAISRRGGTAGSASAHRSGKPQGVQSAAAYRNGQDIRNEQTGETHKADRSTYGLRIVGSEMHAPEGTPARLLTSAGLWNEVDRREKKINAMLARDYDGALPYDRTWEQRRELAREFVKANFTDKGIIVELSFHKFGSGFAPQSKAWETKRKELGDTPFYDLANEPKDPTGPYVLTIPDRAGAPKEYFVFQPHFHAMAATRYVTPDGLGDKIRVPNGLIDPATGRQMNGQKWDSIQHQAVRQSWADIANRGRPEHEHISPLSYRERGIEQAPQENMGMAATKLERNGNVTEIGDKVRQTKRDNAELASLKNEHAQASAEIISLEAARAKRMDKQQQPESIEQIGARQTAANKQALEELERAEAKARETSRREAEETIRQAESLKTQAQKDAERAQRDREKHEAQLEKAAHDGKVQSAESRYAIALGSYDARDPYGSLARAAVTEEALFQKRQNDLKAEMAAAKTFEERQEIDLRRQIEAYDTYALREARIAGINEAISGRVLDRLDRDDHGKVTEDEKARLTGHALAAVNGHERADEYGAKAMALREQREELLQQPEKRRRAEMAQGLSGLARDVERGAMREQPKEASRQPPEQEKTAQADRRNERVEAERPREDRATTTKDRYAPAGKDRYAALDQQDRAEMDRQEREPAREVGRSKGGRSR